MTEILTGIFLLAIGGLHWFALRLPQQYAVLHYFLSGPLVYLLVGASIASFVLTYQELVRAIEELSKGESTSLSHSQHVVSLAKENFETAVLLLAVSVVIYLYSKLLVKIPIWLSESKDAT